MINSIETYTDAGRQVGRARNEGDEARAKFHADWFHRARDLEQGEDRDIAHDAYNLGYREVRRVRPINLA